MSIPEFEPEIREYLKNIGKAVVPYQRHTFQKKASGGTLTEVENGLNELSKAFLYLYYSVFGDDLEEEGNDVEEHDGD